jgi:hypothetical protein
VANAKLEAFLAANEPEAVTPPTEAPEPPAAEVGQSAPVESKPDAAPSEAPQEADDGDLSDAGPSVPRQALLDERSKRQNWVERASRAEAQAEELRKQIEGLRKPAQPMPLQPQQHQQFQFPDPAVDPVGFQVAHAMNNRFNTSQLLAQKEHGKETVAKMVDEFAQMAQHDPTLWERIRQQDDPFDWAFREMERQRLLRDVGEDPSAYEKKLREKWEAERAAQMPAGLAVPTNTPAPNMPQSLAGVRSVAGRAAPVWSGPPSDQQIAADIRAHRMASRQR